MEQLTLCININGDRITKKQVENTLQLQAPYSLPEIRKKYYKMMKTHHPDKTESEIDTSAEISKLYNNLRDYYLSIGLNDNNETKIDIFDPNAYIDHNFGKNSWKAFFGHTVFNNIKTITVIANISILVVKCGIMYGLYSIPSLFTGMSIIKCVVGAILFANLFINH